MFVYFIQCGGPDGPIKIGHATNVSTRRSNLQMGCPFPLNLIAYAAVHDPEEVEDVLHRRFAAAAMRGEWFMATPALLELCGRVAEFHAQALEAHFTDREIPPYPAEFSGP